MQCMGDEDYACKYGMWRKFTNHTIVGTAYPFAGKKFTTLTAAFEFGCDKPTVKVILKYLSVPVNMIQGRYL